MASRPSLGILGIEALHYYVRDLPRTRRFFVDQLDFAELGTSGPELERDGHQRSAAFGAGDALFVIHEPIGEGGRAWRYLRKHPEGVGTVVLDVADIDRTFRLLDERGGTFITDIQRFSDDGGRWRCSPSRPVRRHDLPVRRAARLQPPLPRLRAGRGRGPAAWQPVRLPDRSTT